MIEGHEESHRRSSTFQLWAETVPYTVVANTYNLYGIGAPSKLPEVCVARGPNASYMKQNEYVHACAIAKKHVDKLCVEWFSFIKRFTSVHASQLLPQTLNNQRLCLLVFYMGFGKMCGGRAPVPTFFDFG